MLRMLLNLQGVEEHFVAFGAMNNHDKKLNEGALELITMIPPVQKHVVVLDLLESILTSLLKVLKLALRKLKAILLHERSLETMSSRNVDSKMRFLKEVFCLCNRKRMLKDVFLLGTAEFVGDNVPTLGFLIHFVRSLLIVCESSPGLFVFFGGR
jgi:hypothetical protein